MTPRSALSVSDDGNVIVGLGLSPLGPEGFRWRAGTVIGIGDLPGGPYDSQASDVSADGRVIVGSSWMGFGPDTTEPFVWTETLGMVSLGVLPGAPYHAGGAAAVSGDGRIIVGATIAPIGQDTFIWDPVHGMRSLKAVLMQTYGLNLTGWKLTFPGDISADGTVIVGVGANPAGAGESWIVRGLRPFCYANCDGSEAAGGVPTLTIADFGCFQAKYVLGDLLYADCTMDDRLTIADFGCFQGKYVLGCP